MSSILNHMLKTGILLIFLFLASPLFAAEPEIVKLRENVYAFIGADGAANSGFIVTNEGVVVIDTQGPKELSLVLKKKIKEITQQPVIYVINTHYHGDHTFGNQYFKEAKEIISHENTKKNLVEKEKQHREQFKRFFNEKSLDEFELTLPTKTFANTLSMRVGSVSFELVYLGIGHTDGDIIVYLPTERLVFAGDLLYTGRLPWVQDGNIKNWQEALKKIEWFEADTYVPGHGKAADKKGLKKFRKYFDDLTDEVSKMKKQGKNLDEVIKTISLPRYKNWSKYSEWLGLNAKKVFEEMD
ncbi:MAG: MBL fold metallo-hydrolase [Deltaproteobacteria bacterium]|nr:MBL fold metallo-hydrolase [Deltaproteobacteria bacterium]